MKRGPFFEYNKINSPDGTAVFGRSSAALDRRVGGVRTPHPGPIFFGNLAVWRFIMKSSHRRITIVKIAIRNYRDKRRLIILPEAPGT